MQVWVRVVDSVTEIAIAETDTNEDAVIVGIRLRGVWYTSTDAAVAAGWVLFGTIAVIPA